MEKCQGFYSFKPLVVPIFIPHMGCPHVCTFCDQSVISGDDRHIPSASHIFKKINQFCEFARNRSTVQVAFYGGNFLGLSEKNIRCMLEAVEPFFDKGIVDSIRFSTRPDTVSFQNLSIIREYSVETVELGVQSMDDHVLALSSRGHNSRDSVRAVNALKGEGYEVGIQMMIGLPGDDEARAIRTAKRIINLYPDFVRIYPTLVIRGSPLAKMYIKRLYIPLQLDFCVSLTKKIFLLFQKHGIKIVRMGLQASKDLSDSSKIIAGPYHPAFGHVVYSEVFLDAIKSVLRNFFNVPRIVNIKTHPKNVSRIQGLQCSNLKKIKKEFSLSSVFLEQCDTLDEKFLNVCGQIIKVY